MQHHLQHRLAPSTLFAVMAMCAPLAFAAGGPPAIAPAIGTAATSAAPGAAGWRDGARHRGHGALARQLDLSPTQRADWKRLVQAGRTAARPARQQVRQARAAFESATPGSHGYEAAAERLADARSRAVRARTLRRAGLRSSFYKLLTPAQRTRLADIRAERMAKRKASQESRHRRDPAPAPPAIVPAGFES